MNVRVITDSDLEENGGQFQVEAGRAVGIEQVDDPEGGPATPIYIITTGQRRIERGRPLRVTITNTRDFDGKTAMPVYVVGSFVDPGDGGGGEEPPPVSGPAFIFYITTNSMYFPLV